MLDGAYEILGDKVLTVVHSALTNLKYVEKGLLSHPCPWSTPLRSCSGWMRRG